MNLQRTIDSGVTRVSSSRMLDFPSVFQSCIFSGDQLNYPTGGRTSLSCKWFLRNHESDPDVPVLYTDLCAVHVHGKKIPECPRVPRSFLCVFQFSASLLATFLFLLPLASQSLAAILARDFLESGYCLNGACYKSFS